MAETVLRCAVLDDYQDAARRFGPWERLDGRVETEFFHDHLDDPDAVAARLRDFDIVVAMRERTPFPDALLARLPRLRLLVTTGPRNAAIDAAACQARGITLCGTPGTANATPELTWALILSLARHLPAECASLRAGGPWQQSVGTDLEGACLGVIGLGRLGGRVAAIGQAFGMRVAAWSANLAQARCDELGVERCGTLHDLLARADVATIHLVLSDRTRGLIDARALAAMQPHAVLVNTSRGPIIERDALFDALRDKRIAGAGLDVHDIEPLPADDETRRLPTLLATPHLGYVTAGTYRAFLGGAVEDIEAWLDGAPMRVIGG